MTTLSNAQRIALYTQHSLTSEDWKLICQLAGTGQVSEQLATLSFDQFFGLTVHAFLTTEDSAARQQLAVLLPKFGSRAVLSLFKILSHCNSAARSAAAPASIFSKELSVLASESLCSIEPTAFVVGLEDVLSNQAAAALMPLVIEVLVNLIRGDDGAVLTLLPRLLSSHSWQKLKAHLLKTPTFSEIQTSIQVQQRSAALTQAILNKNIAITTACFDYLSCNLVDAPSAVISA